MPDGAGIVAQQVELAGLGRERRRRRDLAVERHRGDVGEREDCALARRPEREVGRRRRRCREDRVVEPVHQVRRALRVEQAQRRDVPPLDAHAARSPPRPEQLTAIPGRLCVTGRAEVVAKGREFAARANRLAVAVPDAARDNEHVAGVLEQRLVGPRVEGASCRIPDDLVDADRTADSGAVLDDLLVVLARRARRRVAHALGKLHEENGAARRRRVDVAVERDRDARVLVEAVELVDHRELLAVGPVRDAVRRHRERDPAAGSLIGIGHRKPVARERTCGR